MKVNINRQLAGLEDIAFGTGTVMQERQGEMVEITQVNLGNLPFSETLSATEVLTPIYEQVVPHMPEILEADTNAAIATTKAAEASDSAAEASDSAAEASNSAAAALLSEQNALASEQAAALSASEAASLIDDAVPSTVKTYSSAKTQELHNAQAQAIANLASEVSSLIDDTIPSTVKTYSSAKTQELHNAQAQAIANLAGASASFYSSTTQVVPELPAAFTNLVWVNGQASTNTDLFELGINEVLFKKDGNYSFLTSLTFYRLSDGSTMNVTFDMYNADTSITIASAVQNIDMTAGTKETVPLNAVITIVGASDISPIRMKVRMQSTTANGTLELFSFSSILVAQSIANIAEADAVPTDNSTNPVQSNGVFDALALKADLDSPALITPTVNGQNISPYYGRNYIINGNFDIWQRATSQTISGYGSDDRWINRNIGSTKTHSAVTCTDNERALFSASKFSRTVVSSVSGADNVVDKYQKIEDVTKLAGKTVTLSFWAKADTSKNIAIEFWQYFGSGGSPSTAVLGINAQLVSLTSTWQKKTITVTLPSIVGKTLGTDGTHTTYTGVNFWFDAGSNFNTRAANLGQQSGTFDIAQVKLEEGSVATPVEQRPYGLELSLCQLYYETGAARLDTYTDTSSVFGYMVSFKQAKRITPSVEILTPSYINAGSAAASVISKEAFLAYATSISQSQARFAFIYNASAEL